MWSPMDLNLQKTTSPQETDASKCDQSTCPDGSTAGCGGGGWHFSVFPVDPVPRVTEFNVAIDSTQVTLDAFNFTVAGGAAPNDPALHVFSQLGRETAMPEDISSGAAATAGTVTQTIPLTDMTPGEYEIIGEQIKSCNDKRTGLWGGALRMLLARTPPHPGIPERKNGLYKGTYETGRDA